MMWPLLGLSVVTFAYALERIWFWLRLTIWEKKVVQEILRAAKFDLENAEVIASRAQNLAVGRLLLAPLRLREPSPEGFHHALQAARTKELTGMRQGEKVLEMVAAIAPLLGILGTIGGLYAVFANMKNGQVDSADVSAVTLGLSEALITSATGIGIAVIALLFLKLFTNLRSQQIEFFSKVASELELTYLQNWYESSRYLESQFK
ncbi:MotA/TolQ/ExbB proton channel family protein [Mastigocoleus sp. MO_188.B34]|uniref:MotA/TolQ/ExbB proton channel family protein n=1 Tax=Mastigocoleus sp. MO_188.B34 TaxID=3036635 RepID=UPI002618D632|nr:MotA/TolQ/ExbB proton channel family protein [Mastigocoleus sp. MO_188.B34]MDJ0695653.1 MotA/TolQ/ExbB proton channel family protein [Mastigocoleus sp. MO_188.B34]